MREQIPMLDILELDVSFNTEKAAPKDQQVESGVVSSSMISGLYRGAGSTASRKHTENSRSNEPSPGAGGPTRARTRETKTTDSATKLQTLHNSALGEVPA